MQLSLHGYLTVSSAHLARGLVLKIVSEVLRSIRAYVKSLQDYFNTAVWIPSVCAAIPHASVLTFSGIMITYLLNAGLSLNMVTGARASGATFEIGSTFVFPWAVGILSSVTEHTTNGHGMKECHFLDAGNPSSRVDNSSRKEQDQDLDSKQNIPDPEGGVVRVGWWSICFLCLSLVSTRSLPPNSLNYPLRSFVELPKDQSQLTLPRCPPCLASSISIQPSSTPPPPPPPQSPS